MTRHSSVDIDLRIHRLASTQLGLVAHHQASQSGIHPDALAHRCRQGLLIEDFRGVYRLSSAIQTMKSRALAACLCVPDGVLDGRWSAMIHGLPLRHVELDFVDVGVLIVETNRTRIPGITPTRTAFPIASTPWLTGSVLNIAPTLLSLAALKPIDLTARCLDHVIVNDLGSTVEMSQWLSEHPAKRLAGRRVFRSLLDERADGRALFRSKKEMNVRRWLHSAGLQAPTPNYLVDCGNGKSVEVDLAWSELRICLEVSPFHTHGSRIKQERDVERRRQLLLAGWRIVEASDVHLVDPLSFAPIVRALRSLFSH